MWLVGWLCFMTDQSFYSKLFNAKSCLYIYINICGWLVVFYDRSVILNYLMPNPVYTYILIYVVGCVLLQISHSKLFNAKSCLYIYINICGWLVVFYDRSVILNYLMPNPVYTYILIYVVGWLCFMTDQSF